MRVCATALVCVRCQTNLGNSSRRQARAAGVQQGRSPSSLRRMPVRAIRARVNATGGRPLVVVPVACCVLPVACCIMRAACFIMHWCLLHGLWCFVCLHMPSDVSRCAARAQLRVARWMLCCVRCCLLSAVTRCARKSCSNARHVRAPGCARSCRMKRSRAHTRTQGNTLHVPAQMWAGQSRRRCGAGLRSALPPSAP